MSTCEHKFCPGHLAKFNSCVDEALYALTMDGATDDETGDVEFQGHFNLFIFTEPYTVTVDEGHPTARLVEIPTGNYILVSHENGAITVETYETPEDAHRVLAKRREEYNEWMDEDGI